MKTKQKEVMNAVEKWIVCQTTTEDFINEIKAIGEQNV